MLGPVPEVKDMSPDLRSWRGHTRTNGPIWFNEAEKENMNITQLPVLDPEIAHTVACYLHAERRACADLVQANIVRGKDPNSLQTLQDRNTSLADAAMRILERGNLPFGGVNVKRPEPSWITDEDLSEIKHIIRMIPIGVWSVRHHSDRLTAPYIEVRSPDGFSHTVCTQVHENPQANAEISIIAKSQNLLAGMIAEIESRREKVRLDGSCRCPCGTMAITQMGAASCKDNFCRGCGREFVRL